MRTMGCRFVSCLQSCQSPSENSNPENRFIVLAGWVSNIEREACSRARPRRLHGRVRYHAGPRVWAECFCWNRIQASEAPWRACEWYRTLNEASFRPQAVQQEKFEPFTSFRNYYFSCQSRFACHKRKTFKKISSMLISYPRNKKEIIQEIFYENPWSQTLQTVYILA